LDIGQVIVKSGTPDSGKIAAKPGTIVGDEAKCVSAKAAGAADLAAIAAKLGVPVDKIRQAVDSGQVVIVSGTK
jgi:hypothetical protein